MNELEILREHREELNRVREDFRGYLSIVLLILTILITVATANSLSISTPESYENLRFTAIVGLVYFVFLLLSFGISINFLFKKILASIKNMREINDHLSDVHSLYTELNMFGRQDITAQKRFRRIIGDILEDYPDYIEDVDEAYANLILGLSFLFITFSLVVGGILVISEPTPGVGCLSTSAITIFVVSTILARTEKEDKARRGSLVFAIFIFLTTFLIFLIDLPNLMPGLFDAL